MKRIAIILARGGSKRLPRKNILDFHGKPMLAWTIEAALASAQFDRVLVSTDDEEIADVGRSFGAEVPFLRDSAADDFAPSSMATKAALGQAQRYWSEEYHVVAQLMANCPLRDSQDIKASLQVFADRDAVAQISCFQYGWMNPWWAMKLDGNGIPSYVFPEACTARSQDLPPLFCPTGAIWIARASLLNEQETFYLPGHTFHPLSWISALDIDDRNDLEMAKACYYLKQNGTVA